MTLLKTWDSKCLKYLLFLFNLLFVITGIIILAVGATVHEVYGNYSDLLDDGYLSTSAFMMAIGFIIFIISFFGCCGAVKENFCMIVTFSTLLILVFIFELAAGISGYVLRNGVKEMLVGKLNTTIYKYNSVNITEDTKTIDIIQKTFSCCGVTNYTDWYNVFSPNNVVPVSCCGTIYGAVENVTCSPSDPSFYHKPCVDGFGDFIADHAVTIGGVALGLAIVQLLGIVFSCHLSKTLRGHYTSV